MSGFTSLYRGCEHKFHFEATGSHQEVWTLDIGISDKIHLNGDRTELVKRVTHDCFKHLRGEKKEAQIVIEAIEEHEAEESDETAKYSVIYYKILAEKTEGTDGCTWALLLQRNVEDKTFSYNPGDSIGSLLEGADIVGNYQATIDTGAYLRGTSNKAFINRLLAVRRKKESKGKQESILIRSARL